MEDFLPDNVDLEQKLKELHLENKRFEEARVSRRKLLATTLATATVGSLIVSDATARENPKKLENVSNVPGIFHVTVGVEDQWEPSQEELDAVVKLFVEALDEASAGNQGVVATRPGISVEFFPTST